MIDTLTGSLSRLASRIRPASARFQALRRLVVLFLAFNGLVRLGLAVFNQDLSLLAPWRLGPAMLIGALFDLCVGLIGLAPIAWLFGLWPTRPGRSDRGLYLTTGLLLMPLAALSAFVAFSEFTFWNEFASRFNFIAVDYLIYTSEVIGNIRESYNLPLLLVGVGCVAMALWGMAWRWALAPLRTTPGAHPGRWRAALTWGLLAPAVLVLGCDARFKLFSDNGQLNELAGNGYFDFWHAFRANEIDYQRYYRTLDPSIANAELRAALGGPDSPVRAASSTAQPAAGTSASGAAPAFERDITAPGEPRRLNVVMVSIESLSASFLGTFGSAQGLTPNLDRLASEGLLFTQLYATGTRTVRGLEALTLSLPPTPGHSVVKRPGNENLFTLGGVFKDKGYEPLYLYGGYGYFDNMNAFFGGNGYTVIDRTALRADQIHFENIWGVADEDLFSMTVRELDARHEKGQPFFAHVMTTSNHRPFTYPEGRIDIPSKTSREGGVKYTDYAIGQFVAQARQRPWFDQTLFVFVADHTHKGRGRQELPLDAYHIPMIFYAPSWLTPGRNDTTASQIDVAPTLLGMLNLSYRSRFFGHDILREGAARPRALMANYQTVGYYEAGRIVELRPNGYQRVVDAQTGKPSAVPSSQEVEADERLAGKAISYYQVASDALKRGLLKTR